LNSAFSGVTISRYLFFISPTLQSGLQSDRNDVVEAQDISKENQGTHFISF
jgi:hypothetical protein